jgi:hypothetical protein
MVHLSRRALVLLIVLVVAAVVVAGLALHYVYNSSSLATVTVDGGIVHIAEGEDASGYWFGNSTVSITGTENGYPLSVSPGGSFSVGLVLTNEDTVNHTISAVTVQSPFVLQKTSFHIPAVIPPGNDVDLGLTLTAPATAGTYSYSVEIVTTD